MWALSAEPNRCTKLTAPQREPALHAMDCESAGFEWIDASDSTSSIYVYLRKGNEADRPVVVVCNFTPVVRHGYRIGLPFAGEWRELVNTDAREYGGSGVRNDRIEAHGGPWQGRQASAELSLPPLATLLLVPGGTGS